MEVGTLKTFPGGMGLIAYSPPGSPLQSYSEALTAGHSENATVFGHRAFQEVIE